METATDDEIVVDAEPTTTTDIEVAASPTVGMVRFGQEKIELLKATIAEKATNSELDLFIAQCERTGLDPFTRQIYFTKVKGKMTPIVSIDGLRLVASRTGEYAGQTEPEWCGPDGQWVNIWLPDAPPLAARLGVYRNGFAAPVWGVVKWAEFAADKETWRQMPSHMLAKVAESHALRKAFPNEMSGLYTSEEMDRAKSYDGTTNATPQPAPLPPAELVDQVMDDWSMIADEDRKAKIVEWWESNGDGTWKMSHESLAECPLSAVEKLQGVIARAANVEIASKNELREGVVTAIGLMDDDQRGLFDAWCMEDGLAEYSAAKTDDNDVMKMHAWIQAHIVGDEPWPLAEN